MSKKYSTFQQLIHHDMTEWSYRMTRYRQQSSLPVRERLSNKPSPKRSHRDKVMRRIMKTEMKKIIDNIIKPSK